MPGEATVIQTISLLDTVALLVPALPFAAFALILAGTALGDRFDLPATVLAIASAAGSLALSLLLAAELYLHPGIQTPFVAYDVTWTAGGAAPELGYGLMIDPLSALMATVVTLVATLVLVFSLYYMNAEGESGLPRYYAAMTLFTGSMLAFVFSDNLLMSFFFFELIGLCSYLLIGFWYTTPSAASAAKKAFLVTRFGDYFFLVGVAFAFAAFGTFSYHGADSLFAAAQTAMDGGDTLLGVDVGTAVTAVALLVLGGVVGKSAQFPLHTWLPDAMEGPTPVSALIHAATMVAAGVYLVARTFELYALSPTAMLAVAYVGGFTALFAASMALVMDDIKQVLAYSTISQYGYMMLALGAGGYTAAVFHLANHAFFKALLFLGAGSVIIAMHHEQDMWEMGGLKDRLPVTYWTFFAGSLALAGIAPFSGFWSKDEALLAAFRNAAAEPLLLAPLALGVVAVPVTAFYTFRMHALTFHGEPRSTEAGEAEEGGLPVYVPLLTLGALAAVGGFVNAEPLGMHELADYLGSHAYYEHAAASLGYAESFAVSVPLLVIALALAVAGAAAGYLLYRDVDEPLKERFGRAAGVLERRYYLDAAQTKLAFGTLEGSRWIDVFDRDAVDGAVDAVSTVSLGSGDTLRRLQTGVVRDYAAVFATGVVLLLLLVGFVGGWL